MRGIERWLHQHIFKVGWLLTQNFKTTTILYYTFFLPGVLLHEFVYWLAAGIFNVRADRAIKWPEAQEIGELRLNFVQIAPRAGVYRRAIIAIVPLVAGLTLVWWIASTIFDINAVVLTMSSGNLDDVAAGFQQLVQAPDFWLWFYILFTVSNTMYPAVPKDLRGWRTVAGAVVVIIITLFVIGIGNEISQSVAVPLGSFLGVLQNILLLIIGSNLFMTLVLGSIEYAVESTTGRSATFKKGKMIVMTRADMLAERQKAREREQKQLATLTKRNPAALSGPPSIYQFALPIPGGPGEESVTQPVIQISGLPDEKPAAVASVSGKAGADLIPGEATITSEPAAEPIIRIGGSLIGQPRTPDTTDKPAATMTEPAAQPSTPTFPIRPPVFKAPIAKPAADIAIDETEKETETAQAIEDATSILAEKVAQTTPPVSPTKTPVIETPVDEDDDAIDDEMDEDDDIYEDFEDEDFEEIDEDKSPAPIIATKPAAPLSPFARPLPPAAKPVIVSDDEDEEFDDDDDEEFDDKDTDDEPIKPTLPVTPTAFKRPAASLSPFSKPTPKPVISDDDVEDDSEDDDEDETIAPAKPILPAKPTPFKSPAASFSPFSRPAAKPVSDDNDEDDDVDETIAPAKPLLPAKPTPFKSPAASFSPFSRPAAKPVGDDEDEDDEESLMRRGRAGDSDAVSDLFKDFMGDSDDEPETLAPFKPTTSKPSSLFGNLQKPVNPSSGKLSSPSKPSTGMFKSSPQKPSEDDEEDDLDDLRYVDDEEYTDYDDE
jgi:hypothetical protein